MTLSLLGGLCEHRPQRPTPRAEQQRTRIRGGELEHFYIRNPDPNSIFLDNSRAIIIPCGGTEPFLVSAGIFKQYMGARNRIGIGLSYRPARARICNPFRSPGIYSQSGGPVRKPYSSYRPARLHRPAESISWNRFLCSINVYKYGLRLHRLAELISWNQFQGY